jgi:hypothetical protein
VGGNKTYLGDSVYATFDNYGIELTTENGLPTDPSNTIYLDLSVYRALVRFFDMCCIEEAKRENETS